MFVADCQAPGRFRCHEDRVTHFPARTTVLGFNFLPKPKASNFEFRKFFFYLPAQAIFIAFPRALASSGKHPKPIALSSYEKDPSTFRSHQFRGFRHSLSTYVDSPMMACELKWWPTWESQRSAFRGSPALQVGPSTSRKPRAGNFRIGPPLSRRRCRASRMTSNTDSCRSRNSRRRNDVHSHSDLGPCPPCALRRS
jgi:hypothetical protein